MTIVINGRNQIRRTQKANVDFTGGACFDKFGTGLGVWHSVLVALLLGMVGQRPAIANGLDQNCVVNILNRTVQVGKDGGWSMLSVQSTRPVPSAPVRWGR